MAGWGLQWDSDNQKYQLDSTMKLINLQVHSKEECDEDYFSPEAARDAGMKPNDLRKQIPQVRYIFLAQGAFKNYIDQNYQLLTSVHVNVDV